MADVSIYRLSRLFALARQRHGRTMSGVGGRMGGVPGRWGDRCLSIDGVHLMVGRPGMLCTCGRGAWALDQINLRRAGGRLKLAVDGQP